MKTIKAFIKSDDGRFSIEFDGIDWFKDAPTQKILKLAENGWRGCYEADEIARESGNPEVERILEYCNFVPTNGETIGFEVFVDNEDAWNWLAANRSITPDLLECKMLCYSPGDGAFAFNWSDKGGISVPFDVTRRDIEHWRSCDGALYHRWELMIIECQWRLISPVERVKYDALLATGGADSKVEEYEYQWEDDEKTQLVVYSWLSNHGGTRITVKNYSIINSISFYLKHEGTIRAVRAEREQWQFPMGKPRIPAKI